MEVEKLQKRIDQAKRIAKRQGFSQEIADDFSQEAAMTLSQGRKATLHQLFVDYLRSEYGATRDGKEAMHYAERATYVELDKLTMAAAEQLSDVDFHRMLSHLSGSERATCVLRYKWGLGLNEIAECFGITESRVCQQLKAIHGKVRRHLVRAGEA